MVSKLKKIKKKKVRNCPNKGKTEALSAPAPTGRQDLLIVRDLMIKHFTSLKF